MAYKHSTRQSHREERHMKEEQHLLVCMSVSPLPLGQQIWHKASIQQMFDDELHKNMIHVECVKIKIVVL